MSYELPSLREAYAKYFKIGAAPSPMDINIHGDILEKHFSSITPGNEMKFEPIHPSKDVWNFAPADRLVAYCKKNDIALRAHAPVWHKQVAPWFYKDDKGEKLSREALLERLEEHMTVFGARYGADIYCWDVVNEAIAHSGKDLLRNSDWTDIVGSDFIEQSFKIAKKCVPDNVQLFYNDYDEWRPEKRVKFLKVMRDLLDNGAPVDGLGLQQHISIYADMDEIKRSFEEYAKLGVRLHVTELDVSLYTVYDIGRTIITDEMLQRQFDMYVGLFKLYREYSDVLDSVTTWGVGDAMTWLDRSPVRIGGYKPGIPPENPRKNYPLLFYMDHQPKPYTVQIIEDALK